MPTVPRLQEVQDQGFKVQQFQDNGVSNQFGQVAKSFESLDKASAGIASETEKYLLKEKKQADDSVITDAKTRLIKERNDLVYNPENGALSKRGKDAFGVVSQYGELFDQRAAEIEKGLTEDQKFDFKKEREQQSAELNGLLGRHLQSEAQAFDKNNTNSAIDVSRNDAVLNYNIPGKIDQSIADQNIVLSKYADKMGIPRDSDQFKELLIGNASKTHSGVITRMVNNEQDMQAKEYFESNKESLSGQDLIQAEKLVEAGTLRFESQKKSEEITKSSPSYKDALESVRSIEDPKLKDETRKRVESYFSEQARAAEFDQKKTYEDSFHLLDQSKGKMNIPLSVRKKMSPEELKSLDAWQDQLLSGRKSITNWDDYYNLKTLAANPQTKNDFMKTNLLEYRTKLADSEFKDLVNIQTSLQTGDGRADPLLNGYRTDSEIVNTTLGSIGVNVNSKNESILERVNDFRRQADEQKILLQQRTGKPASTQEFQQIVDALSTEIITKERLFFLPDAKQRVFELGKGEAIKAVKVDQVPKGERVKIEDALRRNRIPVTDKTITDAYLQKLRGNFNRGD